MILDEIAEKTRARVEEDKKQIPFFHMRNEAERLAAELPKGNRPKLFPFYQTLKSPGISFICEVKKASPSKGVITEEFPYLEIAKEYEIAGASAISCLTEPYYFQGKDMYLKEITQHVTIPVLRKDFTIDPYMIYQARTLGASAILLICSLLSQSELEEYQAIATELGMSALVEAHDEQEVEMALRAEAYYRCEQPGSEDIYGGYQQFRKVSEDGAKGSLICLRERNQDGRGHCEASGKWHGCGADR